jgi:hypothetical protein
MKKAHLLIPVLLLILSCNKEKNERSPLPKEKVIRVHTVRYDNHIPAKEFHYDENGRVNLQVSYDKSGNLDGYVHYEYNSNGLLKKYLNQLIDFPQFNYDKLFFYNASDQIIREETWQYNTLAGKTEYFYSGSNLREVINEGERLHAVVNFHNTKNVQSITYRTPMDSTLGNINGFVETVVNFEYDTGKRADIGLNYVYGHQPLAGIGSAQFIAYTASENNLTDDPAQTIEYYYDNSDYPVAYHIKWKGIDMDPIKYTVEYIGLEK